MKSFTLVPDQCFECKGKIFVHGVCQKCGRSYRHEDDRHKNTKYNVFKLSKEERRNLNNFNGTDNQSR